MSCQYIVIGHFSDGRKPEILLETNNEEFARATALTHLSRIKGDAYVFDTSTYQCICAVTHEPEDPR